MSAITTSDVSITLESRNVHVFLGSKIASLPIIGFGGDGEEYVTGGVPLPDKGHFGLKRQVDRLFIQQPAGDALVYRYDADDHKIKILTDDNAEDNLAELANGTALDETALPCLLIGE